MKKIIVSITFICYLAVTCGIIVNFHYCMNRLSALQLFVSENKDCPECGMQIKKSHGCCRDEVKIIKMTVDQRTNSTVPFELPSLDAIANLPSPFITTPLINASEVKQYNNHSPPLLTEQDTYLENCVFRV